MSVCPNCRQKLRLLDLGQYCPHCGVNMRFHGFEEQFFTEAKKSELDFARVHVKVKRFKAALVGSKLAILRLCVMVLPLVSMLLPAAQAEIKLPFLDETIGLSALGIYGVFTNGSLGFIGEMSGSAIAGSAFSALKTAVFAETAVAAFAAFVLLSSILSFISIKNMPKIICCLSVAGIAASCAAAFFANAFCASAASAKAGLIGGSMGFGYIAYILAFAVVFTVNLLIIKKGIPVKYDEGDLERYAIAMKVKAGEIKLEDLPQPVVKTAATEAIEEEIRKEREAFEGRTEEQAEEVQI